MRALEKVFIEFYTYYDMIKAMSELGTQLPLYSVLPFLGILLSISLFPLFAPYFWHKHFGKISLFWALVTAIPLIFFFKSKGLYVILHVLLAEYIPFTILLGTLYLISGNIYIKGNFTGTPIFNTIYLSIGTVLASLMGTTGASMVLIKPYLRANEKRGIKTYHIIFFIFLVSNIGGSLTPLGDPPLFLGYLKGVPFFWTLRSFFPMLLCAGTLLLIFYILDKYHFQKEISHASPKEKINFGIEGKHNLIFLLLVPTAILLSGKIHLKEINFLGIERPLQEWLRDIFLVILALFSYLLTPSRVRYKNEFTFFPIKEVAILFFGIFISMIPAISILQAGEKGTLRFVIEKLAGPASYFWLTGSLSAILDNAPTYLTFLSSCIGKFYPGISEKGAILKLLQEHPNYLLAISCGAVFFGAATYIGNAPNFMVRSIAEEKGIAMPSFLGYLFKYSLPLLIPVFILTTIIFFRG
ncbi:MAG: sodium:proton antiporter [Caldimicrobium sp.]